MLYILRLLAKVLASRKLILSRLGIFFKVLLSTLVKEYFNIRENRKL